MKSDDQFYEEATQSERIKATPQKRKLFMKDIEVESEEKENNLITSSPIKQTEDQIFEKVSDYSQTKM